ncbi:MAG: cytochrome c [Nitrospirae bacterium]|nr:cytochrome c [Nitrospirota bacterium]
MQQEPRSKFIFLMIVILFLIIFFGAYITKSSASEKGNAEAGKKIYDARCGLCHGAAGKGDGPAGASLNPKAADFTDKAKMNKSDDELFKLISDGVKGTAMMGFASSLSEQERQDVIAYIRTFSKK